MSLTGVGNAGASIDLDGKLDNYNQWTLKADYGNYHNTVYSGETIEFNGTGGIDVSGVNGIITIDGSGISGGGTYTGGQYITINGSTIDFDYSVSSAKAANTLALRDGSGVLFANNFSMASDRRLKADINPLDVSRNIDLVEFKSFTLKDDTTNTRRYGVVAQEVLKLYPELVNEDGNGELSVSYIDLLVLKTQRLEQQIETLWITIGIVVVIFCLFFLFGKRMFFALILLPAFTFAQSVPDNTSFSLLDVTAVVGGDGLLECFSNSNDDYFNDSYRGNKDNLLNFRDYGPHNADQGTVSPTILLVRIHNVFSQIASFDMNITDDGGTSLTAYGLVFSTTSTSPTLTDNDMSLDYSGGSEGSKTVYMTNPFFDPATQYFVSAYATNSAGTGYSVPQSFTTLTMPEVALSNILNITHNSAVLYGDITNANGSTITLRGFKLSTSPITNENSGNAISDSSSDVGPYSLSATGLDPNTTYYVKAFVGSTHGPADSDNEMVFTTEHTPCNEVLNEADGGFGDPSIVTFDLGTNTGRVILDYEAYDAPDKFIVELDGVEVVNTGYRGHASYQGALDDVLDPNEPIVGGGRGKIPFDKNTTSRIATVKVFGPIYGTEWDVKLTCPD